MVEIVYTIEDNRWKPFLKNIKRYINNIFKNVVDVLGYDVAKNKVVELSITFTNDNNIRTLNKEYRNCDKATNVLSFPIYEKEFLNELKKSDYVPLGDIVLSFETVKKESLNMSFEDHLTHLIVHSILHLFGFDHIKDLEAEEMEALEIKILKNMAIANPYSMD